MTLIEKKIEQTDRLDSSPSWFAWKLLLFFYALPSLTASSFLPKISVRRNWTFAHGVEAYSAYVFS